MGISTLRLAWILAFTSAVSFYACTTDQDKMPIETGSVEPGTAVRRGDLQFKLLGEATSVGKQLPNIALVESGTLKDIDLSQERGRVLLLSIVPSIDTPVCEEQTHYLGEQGKEVSKEVRRITISRDTPFAQKRFAKEAKLSHLEFLSDYRQGDFGRSLGLLTEKTMLLARSVIIVDRKGIIRYIQVVPDLTRLPDMERAFAFAHKLELDKE